MKRFSVCVVLAAGVLGFLAADIQAGNGNRPSGGNYGSRSGGGGAGSYGRPQGGYGNYRGGPKVSNGSPRTFGPKVSNGSPRTYGPKVGKSPSYRGRDHRHWSHKRYWAKYRCNTYYCPRACAWYYWCESRDCYLPVDCIETDPPQGDDTPEEGTGDGTDQEEGQDEPVHGMKITQLDDGVAKAAGLRIGDVILQVNGEVTPTFDTLKAPLQADGEVEVIFLNSENGKVEKVMLTPDNGLIGVGVVPTRTE